MRVKFIKNGFFGLDGHDVIQCCAGDERECTDGHAAQLIKSGYAEHIKPHVAPAERKEEALAVAEYDKEEKHVARRGRPKRNG